MTEAINQLKSVMRPRCAASVQSKQLFASWLRLVGRPVPNRSRYVRKQLGQVPPHLYKQHPEIVANQIVKVVLMRKSRSSGVAFGKLISHDTRDVPSLTQVRVVCYQQARFTI
jgi:hypothetical protein